LTGCSFVFLGPCFDGKAILRSRDFFYSFSLFFFSSPFPPFDFGRVFRPCYFVSPLVLDFPSLFVGTEPSRYSILTPGFSCDDVFLPRNSATKLVFSLVKKILRLPPSFSAPPPCWLVFFVFEFFFSPRMSGFKLMCQALPDLHPPFPAIRTQISFVR